MLEILRETEKHPTADWLYQELKKEFNDLSMGTVYRNLNILIEQGKVKKIESGSTFDRFEANITPHYHFMCEKCGAVIDLDVPVDNDLHEKIYRETGYKPIRHETDFFGICPKCRDA